MTDWAALPLGMRLGLANAAGDAWLTDQMRRALAHLAAIPERVVRYLQRGDGQFRWRYHSHEDLEAAGYRFSGHAYCGAPGCGARVVWYVTPNKKRMAVNLEDYAPHFATCRDPEYFRRRREEKAAQRKEKRRVQTIAREGKEAGTWVKSK